MTLGQRRRRRPRMTVTQADKARQFRALHEAPDAFVVANVWDGGSARMMAGLGFAALATSSGASAGTLGRRDGRVTRDEALNTTTTKLAKRRMDGLHRSPEHHSTPDMAPRARNLSRREL